MAKGKSKAVVAVPVPVAKPVPVPVAKVNVKVAPIPAKYSQLPEDLAREMMASDQRDLLRKGKKALAAGSVIDTGAGIQSGGARAQAAQAQADRVARKNARDDQDLAQALRGGIGGGRGGRNKQAQSIIRRIK